MSKKTINTVILVRASHDEKEKARQIRELRKVARQRGWRVKEVIQESLETDRNKELDRVKKLVEAGKVTKVIVDEVSRIGRRNAAVLEFMLFLEQHQVSLYWHTHSIETLQANGKRSAKAAVVFDLLEEMAGAERQAIVDRTKSGLAAARARGRNGGRPKGLTPEAKRTAAKAAVLYRKQKHSNDQICEKLQISRSSLYRYLHHEGVKL